MTFAVFNPSNVTGVFVGASNYITNPSQAEGDRANPFPTITAALAAAIIGDRLEVLPGVYTENVTMLPFVSIVSASPSSTDTNLHPGQRPEHHYPGTGRRHGDHERHRAGQQYRPFSNSSTGQVFQTELGGLTISSPLVGDPALGSINPMGVGLYSNNSSLLVDRNYFIDAGDGILAYHHGYKPRVARDRKQRDHWQQQWHRCSRQCVQRADHDGRHQQHLRLQYLRAGRSEPGLDRLRAGVHREQYLLAEP